MKILHGFLFSAFCCIFIAFIASIFLKNIPNKDQINTDPPPKITFNTNDKQCIQNPKITFFMYHYVRDDDPNDTKTIRNLSVPPARFEEHMQTVSELAKTQQVTLMNGDDFENAFQQNCFPSQNIWIFTSDDGWIDNATHLAPIAQKYNVPFIFGIISDSAGKPGFMSKQDVIHLSKNPLFTIASHTITHRDHSKMSDGDEKTEICDSKKSLENLINKPVNMFIFPLGKIGKSSEKYLQECGYSIAWSTHFGKNLDWKNLQKYILNRTRIHHDTKASFFENLVKTQK